MGYDLKEGYYKKRPLSENEMWESVNWLFSTYSVNETSYKFIFFKALIDCFDKSSSIGRLSFEQVFTRFTEISWSIILKYEVSQKATTINHKKCVLEQILLEYSMIKLEGKYVPWEDLGENDRIRLCKSVKSKCKRYVVGALFSDMNELFYSFNKEEEWIELNPIIVDFISENNALIENLNYYKWSKFYSVINGAEVERKISLLLDDNFIRRNESLYRAMLAYEFERNSQNKVQINYIPNTLEILYTAYNQKVDSQEKEVNIEDEYVMYDSLEKMREYLNDPLLLINKLKRRR